MQAMRLSLLAALLLIGMASIANAACPAGQVCSEVSGDITVTSTGAATVNKIGGNAVTLGGALTLQTNATALNTVASAGIHNGGVNNGAGAALTNTTVGGFWGLALTPTVSGEPYVELDGVGTGNIPFIQFNFQNGTVSAPTAVQSGNLLGQFSYNGYGYSGNPILEYAEASEIFSTGHGAGIKYFDAVDSASETITHQLAYGGAGGVQVGVPTGGAKGNGTLNIQAALYNNGVLVHSPTAPTIASGGCTTGSTQSISASNGTVAFEVTLGGATCGSTITLTMPAAAHNWVCDAHNITTPASNVLDMTGAASTTAVVLTNYVRTTGVAGNFTGADHLAVKCLPY